MSPVDFSAPPAHLAPDFCLIAPVPSIEIIRVEAGAAGLKLAVADDSAGCGIDSDVAATYTLAAGWQGVLVLDRVCIRVAAGGGKWQRADSAVFAKLQAFLDAGRLPHDAQDGIGQGGGSVGDLSCNAPLQTVGVQDDGGSCSPGPMLTVLPIVGKASGACVAEDEKRRALERWFVTQPAPPCSDFACFGAMLRRTEWYRLVRFLLVQPASLSMQQLSKRYGLSYSYFRLLCRQALGRGGKAEFQRWRSVRALLDMADSGGKLTDVALRHGFASSSHFSDAMKGQFGMSPRELTRMLNQEQ